MTKIIEILKTDLVTAMKAAKQTEDVAVQKQQEAKKTVLRALIGAVQTAEKSGKVAVEFSDEKVLALLNSEVKKRRDTAATYLSVGAQERAAIELAEVEIISAYLPKQLTAEEIKAIVNKFLNGCNEKPSFGEVMKAVTPQTKGISDGRLVSEIVKEALAS